MISQRHRFHGHGSLRAVYQRGQTVRGPLISLKYSQRPEGRPYRVAVVVSKKVSKSAVVRNRIRRRVYEQCRQANPELTAQKDLIFTIFSDQVATMEAAQLQTLLLSMLQKTVQEVA